MSPKQCWLTNISSLASFRILHLGLTDPNAHMYMSLGGVLSDMHPNLVACATVARVAFPKALQMTQTAASTAGGGVLQTPRCSLNPSSGGAHSWSASCSKVSKVQTV